VYVSDLIERAHLERPLKRHHPTHDEARRVPRGLLREEFVEVSGEFIERDEGAFSLHKIFT
jgi:hypothetical protein